MKQFFDQSKEMMELRAIIAEHILDQFHSRYLDLHCTTARERYDLLMQRCPGMDVCCALLFALFPPKTNNIPKLFVSLRRE
jgi:hypothetical protein